jgi:hypothetical protein
MQTRLVLSASLTTYLNHTVEAGGVIDKRMSYDEYLADKQIKVQREEMYLVTSDK